MGRFCSNRSGRETHLSFFKLPSVIKHQGLLTEKLSQKRRDQWIANIKRDAVKHGDIKYPHVCSIHFHEGKKYIKLSRMIYSLKISGISERKGLRFYFQGSQRIFTTKVILTGRRRRTWAILQVLSESLARNLLLHDKNERRKIPGIKFAEKLLKILR